MSTTKALTLFALLSLVYSESTCSSGDKACAVDGGDLESDEVSMLAVTQVKATKHVQMPTPEPGESESETEEPEDGSNQAAGTTTVADAPGLLEQGSDMDSAVEEHIANVLSKANMTMIKKFIRARHALRAQEGSKTSYVLQYHGQYFNNRVNLCSGSFTGVNSCNLAGCESLAALYFTLADVCHPSGWFYSNANANSGGMCRCLKGSATTMTRYYSSSGNSIYKAR